MISPESFAVISTVWFLILISTNLWERRKIPRPRSTTHLTSAKTDQSWVEVDEAVQALTTRLHVCPNRVWAIARSLPGRERNISYLIPRDGTVVGHQGHDQCTFDFCELSRRDFTAVAQRHEPRFCRKFEINRENGTTYPCHQLNRFPPELLDAAALAGKHTVWKLDGMAILPLPESYMAISHVWSDGTGSGPWATGLVNECLYAFFRGVAERFQCKGIWWDTISIPREKTARTRAINQMQSVYEDASVTFVHDCYIRESRWIDAETACLAIIMSPWFSRGWTALELASSQTVKVMFKDSVIKDLDEDILDVVEEACLAQMPIRNQRKRGNLSLNELLTALASRCTSWPRDIATISALLTGIEAIGDETQQSTYQRVLMKIGNVRHGHLFHNSATMTRGFNWCPTTLVDMEPSFSDHPNPADTLKIGQGGSVTGTWRVIHDRRLLSSDCNRYNWKDIHPLIKPRLRLGIAEPENHVLLAELDVNSIERALLVKRTTAVDMYQYIGSVYFHPPLEPGELGNGTMEMREVIIGDLEEKTNDAGLSRATQPISKDIQQQLLAAASNGNGEQVKQSAGEVSSLSLQDEHSWTALHYATWRGHAEIVQYLLDNKADKSVRDSLGQQALHLGARRGNTTIIRLLLGDDRNSADTTGPDADLETIDKTGRTPLSWAAGNGKQLAMGLLLQRGAKHSGDGSGRTPLSWASGNGQEKSIKQLLQNGVKIDTQDVVGHTPLSWAARNGETGAADILLQAGSNLESMDESGRTPLSWAAGNGHNQVVALMLEKGAQLESKDRSGRTPLSWAAERWRDTVEFLLKRGALLESKDLSSRTPLSWAAQNSEKTARLLLESGAKLDCTDQSGRTPLSWAASSGIVRVADLLLNYGARLELQDHSGWAPLSWAAEHKHASLVRLLLSRGARLELKHCSTQNLLLSAVQSGDYDTVKLLYDEGVEQNIPDQLGRTPLSYAAQNGALPIINLLLAEDVTYLASKDKSGRTPVSFAAEHGQVEVVKLLLKYIAQQHSNGNDRQLNARMDFLRQREAQDDSGRSLLSWAAGSGQQAVVDLLLRNGHELECLDNSYWTPLIWAVNNGQEPMVALLAEFGANIEHHDDLGNTPLHHAALHGNENIARILLDYGAEIDCLAYDHTTPLSVAAGSGQDKVVNMLLDSGAQLESHDMPNRTPLSYATGSGQEAVVKTLLRRGAKLESCDDSNRTPFSWAAGNGHETVMRLLLEKGANPEFRDITARTPLSWAAGNGQLGAVVLLLEEDAILNSKSNDSGKTPYLFAAEGGHFSVVELLINKGVEVESKDDSDITALFLAASNGHGEVVRLLLDHGAQVDGEHPFLTPLMTATEGGHCAVAELLLDKGVKLDFRDDFGRTPLSHAAGNPWIIKAMTHQQVVFPQIRDSIDWAPPESKLEDVVKLLLNRSADPNLRDNMGRMPVSYAAQNGKESMLMVLLEEAADIECEDNDNRTLLSWAAEGGHATVIKMLLARNAKLDSRDKLGRTPLSHAAAQSRWEAIVKLLLDHGAELESRDCSGRTPLSWAVEARQVETAQMLISKGANIESEDYSGWTPLFWAVKQEQESHVRFFLEKGASWKGRLDNSGQDLLSYASKCKEPNIQKLFS
ncbi:hypothetical protein GQX73_g4251 [Xylaria multiplex]|uniref:Heterokaryon incompatibility domain-containing protein n=1 Tax=Xylaria multiplex TaxID=323545 RepID=A0A7C8MN34_9PEZI|nr:hypothetical protein GQX73_g4251 [Xylaria multiplex]